MESSEQPQPEAESKPQSFSDSICRIKVESSKNFFLKVPKNGDAFFVILQLGPQYKIKCILTTENILSEEMVNAKASFKLYFKYSGEQIEKTIALDRNKRSIYTYTSLKENFTVIELLKNDSFPEDLPFLSINNEILHKGINYLNQKEISLFMYSSRKDSVIEKGKIIEVKENKFQFIHNAKAKSGVSGTAIGIEEGNEIKLIGIQSGKLTEGKNVGVYIGKIFELLRKEVFKLKENSLLGDEELKAKKEDDIKFLKDDDIDDPLFKDLNIKDTFDFVSSGNKTNGGFKSNVTLSNSLSNTSVIATNKSISMEKKESKAKDNTKEVKASSSEGQSEQQNEQRKKESEKIKSISKKLLSSVQNDKGESPQTNGKKREILAKEMNVMGKILKKNILEDKINSPEKFIDAKEIKEDSEIFPIALLSESLSQKGIVNAISKEPIDPEVSSACLQLLFNGMATKTKLELQFDFGEKRNNELLTNQKEREKFHSEIKQFLSNKTGISFEEISIINPRKGSFVITIILPTLETQSSNGNINGIFRDIFQGEKPKGLVAFSEGNLLEAILLDKNMFDPNGNNKDGGWAEPGEYRGPPGRKMEYFPPYGWKGFGLNVKGKYEDDRWLGYSNEEGEWWIAYHGCRDPTKDVGENGESKNIAKSILTGGFKTGKVHEFNEEGVNIFEDHEGEIEFDKNHPGKLCRHGVYFTPYIEYAQFFAELHDGGFYYNGEKYLLAFMCRINPEFAQVREIINCEWICSGDSNEVRPYRILIKKCEEEISGDKFIEMRTSKIEIKKD